MTEKQNTHKKDHVKTQNEDSQYSSEKRSVESRPYKALTLEVRACLIVGK